MAQNESKPGSHSDESEYHFSDDDISYDVEPEGEPVERKSAAAPMAATVSPEGGLPGLLRNKRVVISAVVFLVLLFIIYKMIFSGSATTEPTIETQLARTSNVTQHVTTKAPPHAAPRAAALPLPQHAEAARMAPNPNPNMPLQQPVSQGLTTMPSVMPVAGSAATPYPPQSLVEKNIVQTETVTAATSQKMEDATQQKMNDLIQKNQAVEDEVQKMNARIVGMESQITELVDLIKKQQQAKEMKESIAANTAAVKQMQAQAPHTKLPVHVQAIAPGVAYLRTNGGENLTVTEGDTIKDVGKVTRIDPYEGIVEINTGRQVVSISYGGSST